MIAILLQKIFETLVNSFTSIKTKLTTLYENIEPPAPPTPSITIDKLVQGEKVFDGSEKTVNIPNLTNYKYLYIYVVEENYTYKDEWRHNAGRCIKVSDIPENGNIDFRVGYMWDSGNIYLKITRTGISCYYSYNNYTQYVDIIGTSEQIF